MLRIAATLILTRLCFISCAQGTDSLMIRRIADEILINSKAYENLRYLTKQIGPGSPAHQNGESRAMGFKTIEESGADKTWLQECKVPHWIRGGRDEAGITSFQPTSGGVGTTKAEKKLEVIALGNSIGTVQRDSGQCSAC
jgi:hypothetical protein